VCASIGISALFIALNHLSKFDLPYHYDHYDFMSMQISEMGTTIASFNARP
jgi:hypothetical protein